MSIKLANINQVFLELGIFYGSWNGETVIKKSWHYVKSQLFLLIIVIFILKHSTALFFDQNSIVTFFIGDFVNFENRTVQMSVLVLSVVFVSWNFFSFLVYRTLNSNEKDQFWLRFVPFHIDRKVTSDYYVHPVGRRFFRNYANKSSTYTVLVGSVPVSGNQSGLPNETELLPGITKAEFYNLQTKYHQYLLLLYPILVVLSVVMIFILNSAYFIGFFYKYGQQSFFWPIFTFNSCVLCFIAYHTYFITMGFFLNYTYVAHLQQLRFKNSLRKFVHLTQSSQVNMSLINYEVRCFNLIVLDMLRINHFWCKVFGLSFYLSMMTIFLLLQMVIYGEAWSMRISFFILAAFIYFACLLFPVLNASLIQEGVSKGL